MVNPMLLERCAMCGEQPQMFGKYGFQLPPDLKHHVAGSSDEFSDLDSPVTSLIFGRFCEDCSNIAEHMVRDGISPASHCTAAHLGYSTAADRPGNSPQHRRQDRRTPAELTEDYLKQAVQRLHTEAGEPIVETAGHGETVFGRYGEELSSQEFGHLFVLLTARNDETYAKFVPNWVDV